MTGRAIRVALIDDEELIRAGLRMVLESADDIRVVGEAGDGADAVNLVAATRPDVVLMDLRMPRLDGLSATEAVRRVADPPDVIVLTTFDTDDHVFDALEIGAAGFLLTDTPPRQLIAAVRVVASGQSMLSPTVTRRVIGRMVSGARSDRRRRAVAAIAALTPREREVLVEVGNGSSNAEIAATLHMSEATVKSHMTHLFEKLGLDNRVQVAIMAHRAGLAH